MPGESQRMALPERTVYVPSIDTPVTDVAESKETLPKVEAVPAGMYDKKTSGIAVLEWGEHLSGGNLVLSTCCRQYPPAAHDMEKSSKCKPAIEREVFFSENSSSFTELRNPELTSSDDSDKAFDPDVCVADTPVVSVGEGGTAADDTNYFVRQRETMSQMHEMVVASPEGRIADVHDGIGQLEDSISASSEVNTGHRGTRQRGASDIASSRILVAMVKAPYNMIKRPFDLVLEKGRKALMRSIQQTGALNYRSDTRANVRAGVSLSREESIAESSSRESSSRPHLRQPETVSNATEVMMSERPPVTITAPGRGLFIAMVKAPYNAVKFPVDIVVGWAQRLFSST